MVRKHISFSVDDWRLVDSEKMIEVWTKVQEYFDIDEAACDYVIASAGKKWKEFKADLKKKYFDETLSDRELMAKRDGRVKESDWKWLIDYWRSSMSEDRVMRAKESRSKVSLLHTAGSKSYARVGHDLGKEQGYPARRDEIFIKTHTRKTKNGAPLPGAESIINKLQETATTNPELMEKSIQDGDLFAHVLGEKEPRGRVRGLGLGPTPQEVGTPGTQKKISTKLQMAIQARCQSRKEVVALRQELDGMKEQLNRVEQFMSTFQGMQNMESTSQHGSTSRHVNPRFCESPINEEQDDYPSTNENAYLDNEVEDVLQEIPEEMQVHRPVLSSRLPPRNRETFHSQGDASLVGKQVILYALTRLETPVAKATILSTDPNNKVGGVSLGMEYYEVFVNSVFKRDAILPRPYDGMETLANAYNMRIAWPCNKMSHAKRSSSQTTGNLGRTKLGRT